MSRIHFFKIVFLSFLIPLVFFGCVSSNERGGSSINSTKTDNNSTTTHPTKDEQVQNGLLLEKIPEMQGPKRTVAVGKFDTIGSFVQKYGNWDIGGGVSAMLTSALKESDRFIVMERANLSQVLNEQEMKAQKITHSGSGPSLGNVIGVNFIIYGAITEFGTGDSGGGFSIGVGSSLLGKMISPGISHQSSKGKLTMDLRIVDTTTSEILETYKVSESVESSGWDFSVGYKQMNFGTNTFVKTPIGQAVRKAINKAVQLIAKKAGDTPWSAQVVDFDSGEVYINAGLNAGVNIGDMFIVERVVKKFTDPGTGKVIGVRKKEIGGFELTGVEKQLSYGSFIPNGPETPQRGDLVSQFE